MNNFHRLALALFFLCFSALAVNAANCGTGYGTCNCSDTLVTDYTLTVGVDGITNGTPCTGGGTVIGLSIISNVTLTCGLGVQILGPGDAGAGMGFYVTNAENITIKNCNLQRFRIGFYLVNVSNATVQASVSNTVNGSTAINMPVAGLYASNINNSQIYGNAFTNLTKSKSNGGPVAGIMIGIPASNNSIHDNFIFKLAQNGSNGQNFGIYVGSASSPAPVGLHTKNNSIYNNWMQNLSGINAIVGGILLMDGAGYAEDNLVQNNFVDNVNTTGSTYFAVGLYLHAANSSNNNFTLNNATNVYAGTASLAAAMAFGTANGTIADQNILGLTNGIGIAIYSNASTNVTNNTVYNASFAGISVSYGGSANTQGTNASITLNTISYCGSGIVLSGSYYDNVTGNTLSFLGSAGINASNSNFDRFINNNLTNANSTYGIVLTDTSRNSVIHGNTISSCSLYGIYLKASIYDDVTYNNVSSANATGISLWDSSYNNVSYNNVSRNGWNAPELLFPVTWNPLYNESSLVGYNSSIYFLAPPNLISTIPPGGFYMNILGYNGTQNLAAVTFTNNSDNLNITAYFNNSAVTNCSDFEAWMLANYSKIVACTYYNSHAYRQNGNLLCYSRDDTLRFTRDSTNWPDFCPVDPYGGISSWDGSNFNTIQYNNLSLNDHSGIVIGAAAIYSADNNMVKYNNITHSLLNAISFSYNNNEIDFNYIFNCSQFGIIGGGYSNKVRNNTLYGVDTALDLSDVRAENNNVTWCNTGVLFWHSTRGEAYNNTIADCEEGIRIITGFVRVNATNNSAYYNTIRNCSDAGISIDHEDVFQESYSVANYFGYNNITDSGDGIKMDQLNDSSEYNYFIGNNINNCSTGISLMGRHRENNFDYNNITNSSGWAVRVISTRKNNFIGNLLASNGNGAYFENLSAVNFTGNSVLDSIGAFSYLVSNSPIEYEGAPYYPFVFSAALDEGGLIEHDDTELPSWFVDGTKNFSMMLINMTSGGDWFNISFYVDYNSGINCAALELQCAPDCHCKKYFPIALIEHGYGAEYEWNSSIPYGVFPGYTSPPYLRPAPRGGIIVRNSNSLWFERNTVYNSTTSNGSITLSYYNISRTALVADGRTCDGAVGIIGSGGAPTAITTSPTEISPTGLFPETENMHMACIDGAFFGLPDNTTLYASANSGVENCSDIVAYGIPCYAFIANTLISNGAGQNFTYNATSVTQPVNGTVISFLAAPGYEEPPYLNYSPHTYAQVSGSSKANVVLVNSSDNFFLDNVISQPSYAFTGDLFLQRSSANNTFLNTTFNKTAVTMQTGGTNPSYYVSRAPLNYGGRNFGDWVQYINSTVDSTDILSDYINLSAAGVDGTFDLNVSLINFTDAGGPPAPVNWNMTVYYDPSLGWDCAIIEAAVCPAQGGTCNCWYNGTAFHENGAGNDYTWNLDPAGPTIIAPNTDPAFLNRTTLPNSIIVQWFLGVLVENYTFVPLAGSNVTVNDTHGILSADNEPTDVGGYIPYRVATEYTQNDLQAYGVNATMFIPFNFTAIAPPLTAYVTNTTLYNVTRSQIFTILLYSTNPDLVLTAITPDPNKILLYDENVSFAITVFNGGGDPFSSISVHVNLSNSGASFDCPIFPIERFKSKTIMCGYTQANVSAINVTATVDALLGEPNTANNYRSIIVNAYNQKVQSGLPDTNLFVAVLAALAAAMLLSRRKGKTKK